MRHSSNERKVLRQPATCSADQMPGVSAYPTPKGLTTVASEMISPADARCA